MKSHESDRLAATLAQRAGRDPNAAQVADAIVAVWQEIDAALIPIIGHLGTVALYKRSLYLTGAHHPWLAGMHDGIQADMDLAAVRSVFAQQGSVPAAAGGDTLLQTFYKLLATLVGPSLTERLLQSVWAHPSSGRTAQDTSP